MKIIKLEAENIKRLVAVEITPDGHMVQISGRNGAGKTSVLDAIWWALAGADAIQAKPIREGETTAHITLDLGEIVVERSFTSKGSYLKVSNADGAQFQSPQKMLDDLVGKLSFDPLAFMRERPGEQVVMLQGLAGVDGSTVKAENAADYEARRDLNRDAKAARLRADQGFDVPDDAPDEEIDIGELMAKLIAVEHDNDEIDRAQESLDALLDRIRKGKELIKTLEAEADEIRPKTLEEPTITDWLRTDISMAQERNADAAAKRARNETLITAQDLETEAQALTDAMAARTAKFETEVAAAHLPVEGLTIDLEEGVMFQGIPLAQASDAEQIRGSTALAMALNPKVKVLRIRDGSLLDEDSIGMIAEMTEAEDYQVWVEVVDTTGEVGIVIEDGMVAGDG